MRYKVIFSQLDNIYGRDVSFEFRKRHASLKAAIVVARRLLGRGSTEVQVIDTNNGKSWKIEAREGDGPHGI